MFLLVFELPSLPRLIWSSEFCVQVFYVMGKGLSGELFCKPTGHDAPLFVVWLILDAVSDLQ